MKYLQEIM